MHDIPESIPESVTFLLESESTKSNWAGTRIGIKDEALLGGSMIPAPFDSTLKEGI